MVKILFLFQIAILGSMSIQFWKLKVMVEEKGTGTYMRSTINSKAAEDEM
jgi:hypothetical protein